MKRIIALAVILLGAGCAGYDGANLVPGVATMAEVEKEMGPSKATRPGPEGETVLWFPRLPDGRVSYAALIGKDGKLIGIEQRLTRHYLMLIKPGVSTENDVLDILGPPQSKQWFDRLETTAWSYNARGINPQIYVVEVQKDGIVKRRYSYDDPQFIPLR